MKALWRQWQQRFSAYSVRERGLLAVAAIALVIYVGDALWLSPIYDRAKGFARQAAQQEKEFAGLQQQLFALKAESSVDKNAALRDGLAGIEQELSQLDQALAGLEQTLVPPNQMPRLLAKLMRLRPGVHLAGLQTRPVEPLDAAGNPIKEGSTDAQAFMFRHGFEVTLTGPYLELAGWLSELESSTQQLLWDSARLEANADQTSTLVLVFYTLSLDSSWMAL